MDPEIWSTILDNPRFIVKFISEIALGLIVAYLFFNLYKMVEKNQKLLMSMQKEIEKLKK